MSAIKSICVYCGASLGNSPEYLKLAQEMGRQLARRRIRLVYGGGRVGLMGRSPMRLWPKAGESSASFPITCKRPKSDMTASANSGSSSPCTPASV
jgi:predicted Rossmann-fold nucleotide-binding protein